MSEERLAYLRRLSACNVPAHPNKGMASKVSDDPASMQRIAFLRQKAGAPGASSKCKRRRRGRRGQRADAGEEPRSQKRKHFHTCWVQLRPEAPLGGPTVHSIFQISAMLIQFAEALLGANCLRQRLLQWEWVVSTAFSGAFFQKWQ